MRTTEIISTGEIQASLGDWWGPGASAAQLQWRGREHGGVSPGPVQGPGGDLLFSWLFWVSQGHAHNLSLCSALVPAA